MRTDDVDGANAAVSSNSLFTDCPLPIVNLNLDEEVEIDLAAIAGKFVDKIVVAKASALENVPGIIPPSKLLPGAKSVIVLASEMPARMVELAANQEAECAMSYAYGQYQLIRETLWAAHDVASALELKGEKSLPIADFALEPQRNLAPYWEFAWAHLGHPDLRQNALAAAAAGLGTLGEHGFVLSREFGPRMRFSFLVTTAELEPTPADNAEHCLHCGACAKACPLSALGEKDANGVRSRDEVKCRWSRQLGMVPETGISSIGWDIKDGEIPAQLTPEAIAEANSRKDPLQLKGYKYPNQIDTVVERCLQACPVGK
jgi:ferredoxin